MNIKILNGYDDYKLSRCKLGQSYTIKKAKKCDNHDCECLSGRYHYTIRINNEDLCLCGMILANEKSKILLDKNRKYLK